MPITKTHILASFPEFRNNEILGESNTQQQWIALEFSRKIQAMTRRVKICKAKGGGE